ncbi:MAG: S4 domain-containing protein, partial [Clostridia bacterium]
NIDDNDVEKCLKLLTYLPLDTIAELCKFNDERMNIAKQRLAFEVTAIVHSQQQAELAQKQALAAFGGDDQNMPALTIDGNITNIIDILMAVGVVKSKSEARNLIGGGGIVVDEQKIDDINYTLTDSQKANGFVLHKGKKVHFKIELK